MKAVSDDLEKVGIAHVRRFGTTSKIRIQLRIGQIQNAFEPGLIEVAERSEPIAQKRLQYSVELAHAAATTPPEPCFATVGFGTHCELNVRPGWVSAAALP